MDIDNAAKGLKNLFPLFHLKNNAPVEHIFDLKTEDVLATFFLLENEDYQKFLYVKYDLRNNQLTECYPTFFGNFEDSINYLQVCDGSKAVKDRQSYFSLPIILENGEYKFDYQPDYSIYYPQKDNRTIIRKLDGKFEVGYYQVSSLSQTSFPLYWKTRDLIINSQPDYMIFYFDKEEMKSPIKINLGYNMLNSRYKGLSQFHNAVKEKMDELVHNS